MAECLEKIDDRILLDVKRLLWGRDLRDDVFSRWTQVYFAWCCSFVQRVPHCPSISNMNSRFFCFTFSDCEKTALVQHEGGPCAVIAPVQAFIIKNAFFSESPKENLSLVSAEEATDLLLEALGDILVEVSSGNYSIVSLEDEEESHDQNNQSDGRASSEDTGESSCKKSRLDQELFHSKLKCTQCRTEEMMRKNLKTKLSHYTMSSGVLLYLYSIIITKGVEQIKNEVEDPGEPLIDGLHGHGSQSLINLLISGKAVTNVWDNDKEVCGLKLRGVQKRSTIGFLTYMEHLRYCEVGWNLKNPVYPVWLVGSETHLTVLFSKTTNLVINESVEAYARRIFHRFDPEGNGFIAASLLGDVLATLDLVSEKEYVDIMVSKLDEENLGIITLSSFMEEFYAGETTPEVPTNFKLYHYNGLARSSHENKVCYVEASAVLQDELEVQILTDVSPIKMVLQTKWPTIEVRWTEDNTPSIN